MTPDSTPTPDQIENARLAGWDVGTPGEPDYPKVPPGGWDVHGSPPGDDVVDGEVAQQENASHG